MPDGQRMAETLDLLRTLLDTADLPPGPFTWEQVYEVGSHVHWAVCDPTSTAEGCVTDGYLVLRAVLPTWSGDAPETWQQPLSTYPRLALIAALLTHAEAWWTHTAALRAAAWAVVRHWREFEQMHQFEATIAALEQVLREGEATTGQEGR